MEIVLDSTIFWQSFDLFSHIRVHDKINTFCMKQSGQQSTYGQFTDIPIKLETQINAPNPNSSTSNIKMPTEASSISDASFEKVEQDFLRECEIARVESFYSEMFLKLTGKLTKNQRIELLQNEIDLIKQQQSDYHLIREAVEQRSAQILELASKLELYEQNRILKVSKLISCCSRLERIRISTIMLVERITTWKQKLIQLQRKNKIQGGISLIYFKFNGVSVMEIINQDLQFLKKTILRKYIKLSVDFDPFLMCPYYEMLNNLKSKMYKHRCIVDLFSLSNPMSMRMHQANTILQQELSGYEPISHRTQIKRRMTIDSTANNPPKSKILTSTPSAYDNIINKKNIDRSLERAHRLQTKQKYTHSLSKNEVKEKISQTQKIPEMRKSRYWGNVNMFPRIQKYRFSTLEDDTESFSQNSIAVNKTQPYVIREGRKINIKSETLIKHISSNLQVKPNLQPAPNPPKILGRIPTVMANKQMQVPTNNQGKVASEPSQHSSVTLNVKKEQIERLQKEIITQEKQQIKSQLKPETPKESIQQQVLTRPQAPRPRNKSIYKQQVIAANKPHLEQPLPQIQGPRPRNKSIQKQLAMVTKLENIDPQLSSFPVALDNIQVYPLNSSTASKPLKQIDPVPSQAAQPMMKPIRVPNRSDERVEQKSEKKIEAQIAPITSKSVLNSQSLFQPRPRSDESPRQLSEKSIQVASSEASSSQIQFEFIRQLYSAQKSISKTTLSLTSNPSEPSLFTLLTHTLKLSDYRPFVLSLIQNMSPTDSTVMRQMLLIEQRYFSHTYLHEIKENERTIFVIVWYVSKNLQARTLNLMCLRQFNEPESAPVSKLLKIYLNGVMRIDPCGSVCYVQHKLDNSTEMKGHLLKLGLREISNKLTIPSLKPTCLQLERTVRCLNTELQESLFSFELTNLIIEYSNFNYFYSNQIEGFNSDNYFEEVTICELVKSNIREQNLRLNEEGSDRYLQIKELIKNTPNSILKIKTMAFKSIQECNGYLRDVLLDVYPTNSFVKDVGVSISRFYDSLPFEYLVNQGCLIFRTDNINSFYGQSMTYRFTVIRTVRSFGDVYLAFIKRTTVVDVYAKLSLTETLKHFTEQILNTYIFKSVHSVCIRFFKKQLYGKIKNLDKEFTVFGNMSISFNWLDFLHGTKLYDMAEAPIPFVSSMIFSILTRSEDGKFRALVGTRIDDKDFISS